MADAFISYSHNDRDFALDLYRRLVAAGKEPWVDEEGIPPASRWADDLKEAIEGADAFVFVISPDSAASLECAKEVEHAAALNKRIIPVVARPTPVENLPPLLRAQQFVPGRGVFSDDPEASLQALVSAIDTDLDWVRAHTKWGRRALEWESHTRDGGFLLGGSELQAAEQWLAASSGRRPEPTDLQNAYVLASRQRATRRQRGVTSVALVVALAMAGLAAFAGVQWRAAVVQHRVSYSRQLASEAEQQMSADPALALDLALRGYDSSHTAQAEQALRQATDLDPLRAFLPILPGAQNDPVTMGPATFDPSGKWVVTSDNNQDVEVWGWQLHSGRGSAAEPYVIHVPANANSIAPRAVFADGGRDVVIASADGTLRRWHWATTGKLQLLGHYDNSINKKWVKFAVPPVSADGRLVASIETDGTVVISSVPPLRSFPLALPVGRADTNPLVAFSPDDRVVVTAAANGTDTAWCLAASCLGQVINRFTFDASAVAISPDNRHVSMAGDKSTTNVETFDLSDPHAVADAVVHDVVPVPGLAQGRTDVNQINALAYTGDGAFLAGGGGDSSLRVWGRNDATPATYLNGEYDGFAGVAFSPDGRYLASRSTSGGVVVSDWRAGTDGDSLYNGAERAAFSPDNRHLAVAVSTGRIVWWDWLANTVKALPLGYRHDAELLVSPSGRYIAVSGNGGPGMAGVTVYDLHSGQDVAAWTGRTFPQVLPSDLHFSPDGQVLAAVVPSTDTKAPGAHPGLAVWRWQQPPDGIGTATTLPDVGGNGPLAADNTAVISVADDGTVLYLSDDRVYQWSGRSGQAPVPMGPSGPVSDQAVNGTMPLGGTTIATATSDGVWVWNYRSGRELAPPRTGLLFPSISADPTGKLLAISSSSGVVSVWDWSSGQPPVTAASLSQGGGVAYSPDGSTLLLTVPGTGVRLLPAGWVGSLTELVRLATSEAVRPLTAAEAKLYL